MDGIKDGSAYSIKAHRPSDANNILKSTDERLLSAEERVEKMLTSVSNHEAVLGPMLAYTHAHSSDKSMPFPAPWGMPTVEWDPFIHRPTVSSLFSLQSYASGGFLKNLAQSEPFMGPASGWAATSKLNGRMDVRKGIWGVVHTKVDAKVGTVTTNVSLQQQLDAGPKSRQRQQADAIKRGEYIPKKFRVPQPKKRKASPPPSRPLPKRERLSPVLDNVRPTRHSPPPRVRHERNDSPKPRAASPPKSAPVVPFAMPTQSAFAAFQTTEYKPPLLSSEPPRKQLAFAPPRKQLSFASEVKLEPVEPVDTYCPDCYCHGEQHFPFMLGCVKCEVWYHGPCLPNALLNDDDVQKWEAEHGVEWTCPKCLEG
jgi:hypothetical protein